MNTQWFKLYASGETNGMYIVKESLEIAPHLFERQVRELLTTPGRIGDRWPVINVYGSTRRLFRRRFDIAAPLFTHGCPAMSKRAMERLRGATEGFVEWLPLKHRGGLEFFIAHPLLMLDVIDKTKSQITYVSGHENVPKYVTSLHREWIHETKELDQTPIFCTPESAGRAPYVTREIMELFAAEQITGAAFETLGISSVAARQTAS